MTESHGEQEFAFFPGFTRRGRAAHIAPLRPLETGDEGFPSDSQGRAASLLELLDVIKQLRFGRLTGVNRHGEFLLQKLSLFLPDVKLVFPWGKTFDFEFSILVGDGGEGMIDNQ